MRLADFVLCMIGFMVLAVGCRSSRNAEAPVAPQQIAVLEDPIPGDLRVSWGSGGGITGRWSGYTIEADGRLMAWQGQLALENPTPAGQVPADSLRAIWKAVSDMHFFDVERTEPANMTSVLEVVAEGRTHRVTWPARVEGIEPAVSPIDALFARCHAIAAAHRE